MGFRAGAAVIVFLVGRLIALLAWFGRGTWIHLRGVLYLERYAILGGRAQTGWLNAYIHRFWAPDDDRGPHCHPRRWGVSIILWGGYWEHRVGRRARYFGPGAVNWLPAGAFHRVAEVRPGTLTLFITGPKHGDSWGYLVNGEYVPKKKEGGCDGCPHGSTICKGTIK